MIVLELLPFPLPSTDQLCSHLLGDLCPGKSLPSCPMLNENRRQVCEAAVHTQGVLVPTQKRRLSLKTLEHPK